jgi:hypothetical protein
LHQGFRRWLRLLRHNPPNPQTSADLFQLAQPFDFRGTTLVTTPPAADAVDNKDDLVRAPIMTLEENLPVCYMLRIYRVARESPDSDSTRPAGYTTCPRASRFQFKTAVDSREIAPR